MSQVCSSWRQALGQERTALQHLRFSRLEHLPGRSGSSSGSNNIVELPWLVQQAVKAGNVAATVAAARWLERRQGQRQGRSRASGSTGAGPASAAVAALAGTWYNSCVAAAAAVQAASAAGAVGGRGHDEAARFWRKAAKLGHPEGQWKLGWGHYKVGSPSYLCCLARLPGSWLARLVAHVDSLACRPAPASAPPMPTNTLGALCCCFRRA